MHHYIKQAATLRDYALHLSFADGLEGVIRLDRILDKSPLFAELKDSKLFRKVAVDQKWHTITWPNGVDLAPDVLHEKIHAANGTIAEY